MDRREQMPSATLLRILAVAAALAGSAVGALAEPSPQSRKIKSGDFIQGYVRAGAIVVTTGHLAAVDGRVLLSPSMPSAMVPAMSTTRLPPADRARVQAHCAAVRITSGGCRVTLQGQVAIDARGHPSSQARADDLAHGSTATSRRWSA